MEKYIQKPDYNQILFKIIENNDVEALSEILNTDVDLETKGYNSRTPLIVASQRGYTEIVNLLLKSGADKDAKDSIGQTALMYACNNGHFKVVELLLQFGADKTHKDNLGRSALTFATGYDEIIKLLSGKPPIRSPKEILTEIQTFFDSLKASLNLN